MLPTNLATVMSFDTSKVSDMTLLLSALTYASIDVRFLPMTLKWNIRREASADFSVVIEPLSFIRENCMTKVESDSTSSVILSKPKRL